MTATHREVSLALLLLTGASACGGGSHVRDLGASDAFPGFPSSAWAGLVNAEAVFVSNHEHKFGTDLVEEGVLPIQLTLGLRGKDQEYAQIRLEPERTDFRLYLADGTVLLPVSTTGVARLVGDEQADQVRKLALEPGVLPTLERAKERRSFVFFSLRLLGAPEVEDGKLLVERGKRVEALDLSKSLLVFNVTLETGLESFHVGIRIE